MGFRRIELNFHEKKLLYFKIPLMIRALEVLFLAVPATESVHIRASKLVCFPSVLQLTRLSGYNIVWHTKSASFFGDPHKPILVVSSVFCRSIDGRHI